MVTDHRDKLAITCSGICLVHCLLTPILLTMGATGMLISAFESEWVHILLLIPVIVLAMLSLPAGFRQHQAATPITMALLGIPLMIFALMFEGWTETAMTVIGAMMLIAAHLSNFVLTRQQSTAEQGEVTAC